MLPPRMSTIGGRSIGEFSERVSNGHTQSTISLNELTTTMTDGGIVISVTVADVVLRKVVYADGRFHVQIEEARDRIAFVGSAGRASLTYGPETVSLLPGGDPATLKRAKSLLAGAKVVSTFRRLAERLSRTQRRSACAVSVRLTWALVAEVAGDAGVMTQLTALSSTRVRHLDSISVTSDGFERSWSEYAVRLVSPADQQDKARAGALQLRSLDAAFGILLALESAWYATVTAWNRRRSCAVG